MLSRVPVNTNFFPASGPFGRVTAAGRTPASSSFLITFRFCFSTKKRRMLAAGVRPAAVSLPKGPLAGKKFVLTGTLETMTRPEAQRRIEALGGRVQSSVSKETDYVVVGADPGSKATKAKALGVRTLEEKAFVKLLGD